MLVHFNRLLELWPFHYCQIHNIIERNRFLFSLYKLKFNWFDHYFWISFNRIFSHLLCMINKWLEKFKLNEYSYFNINLKYSHIFTWANRQFNLYFNQHYKNKIFKSSSGADLDVHFSPKNNNRWEQLLLFNRLNVNCIV